MTFLGFDYGTLNIGVAIGQTITQSARPLDTVIVRDSVPAWDAIDKLVAEWQPDGFVVGLPFSTEGEDTPMCDQARRFGKSLERRYQLPVFWVDESLTTKAALVALRSQGASRDKLIRERDRVAAQLILETFLHEPRPYDSQP